MSKQNNFFYNFIMDSQSAESIVTKKQQKSITACPVTGTENPVTLTRVTLQSTPGKCELKEVMNNWRMERPIKTIIQVCDKKIPESLVITNQKLKESVACSMTEIEICNTLAGIAAPLAQISKSNSTNNRKMENPVKETVRLSIKAAPKCDGNFHINEDLTVRKAKELSKHSRKRRRRQKKKVPQPAKVKSFPANQNKSGDSLKIFMKSITNREDEVDSVCVPLESSSQSLLRSNDILCVTVRDESDGIEFLFHDLSNTSDDDSDWDVHGSCEMLPEEVEFGFSGLFMTSFTTPMSEQNHFLSFSQNSDSCAIFGDAYQVPAALQKVNRLWAETNKEVDHKPKLPPKVSFAPDDQLVDILHIEMYERKGEWERYATERFRFNKRIEKMEALISPYLTEKHRIQVLQRNEKSTL